jgi:hypothetical protein
VTFKSDIPAGDGKIANLFLQCTDPLHEVGMDKQFKTGSKIERKMNHRLLMENCIYRLACVLGIHCTIRCILKRGRDTQVLPDDSLFTFVSEVDKKVLLSCRFTA